MAKPIRSRQLDARSKLEFIFPSDDSTFPLIVTLPFFENIQVKEKKRANFKKYNLLSRPGQLYTYTGAESRKFTLNFHMSFPHILQEHGAQAIENFRRYVDSEVPNIKRKAFFDYESGSYQINDLDSKGLRAYAAEARKNFLAGDEPQPSEELNTVLNGIGAGVDLALGVVQTLRDNTPIINLLGKGTDTQDAVSQHEKVIDLVVYWTQIIRASVTNNAQNPVYGPPVIRLKHGILYDNIPCICTDYSVEAVEDAGYDLQTLMPRRIKYSMSLEEYRAGDFSKFDSDSTKAIKRDNVVGWEAVISDPIQSMDPGAPRPSALNTVLGI